MIGEQTRVRVKKANQVVVGVCLKPLLLVGHFADSLSCVTDSTERL